MSPSDSVQYHELGWSVARPVSQEPAQSSWSKLLAALPSHLALIGFLVIPMAFGDEQSPHIDKTATVVVASVLIGVAYASSFSLVLFNTHERTFLIHSLFVPCLMSNLFALLNVLLNILCRNLVPMGLLEILSMSFSAAFSFVYGAAALWVYARNINDRLRRDSKRGTIVLTDEEMQRQQLQRLLEQNSPRKTLSPRAMQKTFRVNVPDRISFIPSPHEEGYNYGLSE